MNYIWALRNPASYDMYMFALAAGLLAGEGLGGVLQALLAVAGVDGSSEFVVPFINFIPSRHPDSRGKPLET